MAGNTARYGRVVIVAVVALFLSATLAWRLSHRPVDPVGTTYQDVEAVKGEDRCVDGDYQIRAGGHVWKAIVGFTDTRRSASYRGRLTVTKVTDATANTYAMEDTATFTAEGIAPMEFHPTAAIVCELS